MKGAEYGVYKTESDAKANKNKVKTLTIGKYDNSEKTRTGQMKLNWMKVLTMLRKPRIQKAML